MKISVITPNYNGERFLARCIESVLAQREDGIDLEYILIDGGSKDGSAGIITGYADRISRVVNEPDNGPADAINKGFRLATGDIVAWLNADDCYRPGALARVAEVMTAHPDKALCFGHCPIIDEQDREIRVPITRFKEAFFGISSRFTIQSINYISQPAMYMRRSALLRAGELDWRLKCAWDYDLILRLWRQGGAVCVGPPALACFRWHSGSLSGRHFRRQFREEWLIAARDAGVLRLQTALHLGVWWGIVFCYTLMAWRRGRGRDRSGRRPDGVEP